MKRRKKAKIDVEAGWAAGWHRRKFREVVTRPEFPGLVTLARLANMLRFVYSVSVKAKGVGPEIRRQSMNAFYVSGALLVEAERTIEGVGRYFSKQEDFIDLVKSVHSEDYERVVSRFREFRNRAGFHFDEQPVEPALKRIAARDHKFIAFLTAYGTVSKDMYYDLSDQVAMELILGEDDYGEWFKEWLALSGKVLNHVFNAIENADPRAPRAARRRCARRTVGGGGGVVRTRWGSRQVCGSAVAEVCSARVECGRAMTDGGAVAVRRAPFGVRRADGRAPAGRQRRRKPWGGGPEGGKLAGARKDFSICVPASTGSRRGAA